MKLFLIFILIVNSFVITACEFPYEVEEGLSHEEYINKARQTLNNRQTEQAIALYEKALTIKPDDGKTHYILGDLYYSEWRRSYEAAQHKAQYKLLRNKKRKEAGDFEKQLEKYGLKREYKKLAEQEFNEAIKYDPGNWQARYRIATNYLNNGQYKEAIDGYKKVIALNPEYLNSYGLLGEAYTNTGSYDLALKYLDIAINKDPDDEYSYYKLGLVYRKMNKGEKFNEMLQILKKRESVFYDELRLSLYR